MVKLEHSEHEKNFLDTVNSCSAKYHALRMVKNKTSMGKKRYRAVCGGNTPKQKLFWCFVLKFESNGLYEHCFVRRRVC